MNASDNAFHKQHRLTTTRITSQVCRQWRQVVLSSTKMWGRLILIESRQKIEWIEEVMRRAGPTSLLWIEFNSLGLLGHYESRLSLLSRILQDWNRIESLTIITRSGLWSNILDPRTTSAPVLRSFYIIDPNFLIWDEAVDVIPGNLFSNSAPHLSTFFCTGFSIYSNKNLLSNLKTLHFSPENVDDISDVFTWAPQLERIGIDARSRCFQLQDATSCAAITSLSRAILPRLSHLKAKMSLSAFSALLSTPSPLPPITFIEIIILPGDDLNTEGILPNTVKNIFQHCIVAPTDPGVTVSWSITIRPSSLSFQAEYISGPTNITLCLDFKWENAVSLLLKCLSPHIANVTSLVLDFRYQFEMFPSKDLGDAFRQIADVTAIVVDQSSIGFYNRIESSGGLLFPALKLMKCDGTVYRNHGYMEDLCSFLRRRVEGGLEIPSVQIIEVSNRASNKKKLCTDLSKRWFGTRVEFVSSVMIERAHRNQLIQ